jgi:hypothetical protein
MEKNTIIKPLIIEPPVVEGARLKKDNEILLKKPAHELLGIHSALEEILTISLDQKSTYWLSRSYRNIEAAFKKIKHMEDDLIEQYKTKTLQRGTVEQAVVEKEDPSNPERNIELKKNYEIFSAEIGKLHKSEMEVYVFTVPAIKFLELNPDVHSFLGKLWILLEDLIVGQSSEEVEALMNFDPIEIPKENAQKSKILTQ